MKEKKEKNPKIEALKESFKIGAAVPFKAIKMKDAIKLAYQMTKDPEEKQTEEDKARRKKQYNIQFWFGVPSLIIALILLIWTAIISRWWLFGLTGVPFLLSALLLNAKPK